MRYATIVAVLAKSTHIFGEKSHFGGRIKTIAYFLYERVNAAIFSWYHVAPIIASKIEVANVVFFSPLVFVFHLLLFVWRICCKIVTTNNKAKSVLHLTEPLSRKVRRVKIWIEWIEHDGICLNKELYYGKRWCWCQCTMGSMEQNAHNTFIYKYIYIYNEVNRSTGNLIWSKKFLLYRLDSYSLWSVANMLLIGFDELGDCNECSNFVMCSRLKIIVYSFY